MAWNTHIPKFRRFVLQNFPFIEEDFDALTDYELICKVIEYLNQVITSQNEVIAEVGRFETDVNNEIDEFETNITNNFNRLEGLFNDLKSFVDNYFDNLDVQEEINNKLEQMAEDGTLQEIITAYIQSSVAWTFSSLSDALNATNLVNGSYVHILGYNSIGDGGDGYFHVRNKTVDEVEDGMFTYSYSDTLMFELVDNGTITTNQCGIFGDNTTDQTSKLQQFFAHDTENYTVKEGNYLVTGNLSLTSNSHISFEPDANIEFTGTSEDYFVFYMLNTSNIIIDNGSLSGNRLDHTPGSLSSGFLYAIMYSQNIVLNNCKAKDAWADGFYVGNSFTESPTQETKNIRLNNCTSITPGRSGFSVCSGENIILSNCETREPGTTPGAGLDIETEGNTTDYSSYVKLKDVLIENFKSYKSKYGISTYNNDHTYSNIVVINHISDEDDCGESVNIKEQGDIKFIGSIITKSKDHAVMVFNSSGTSNVYIKNILIDGCSADPATNSTGIDLYGSTNDSDTLKNITIDGVQYLNSYGVSNYAYLISQQHFKINNVIMKNIYLDETAPPIAFYNAGDVKFINCIIEKGTDTTISRYNIGNLITDSRELTANKNKNFYYPMPNGEYQFNLVNTGSGFANAIIFANDYTVTKGGVTQSNTFIGSSIDAIIKFRIIGNKAVIENS